jgi:death-on-curing protein
MISLERALHIHHKSIEEFGGSSCIRDEGLLLGALARPFQTFDQQELYETPADKAAAIFESLIINHPFMDGNKRTAYVLMRILLIMFNHDVMAFDKEKYQMTIAASCGEICFDEIKLWIEEHLVSVNP